MKRRLDGSSCGNQRVPPTAVSERRLGSDG
jgi:hypothetical protein